MVGSRGVTRPPGPSSKLVHPASSPLRHCLLTFLMMAIFLTVHDCAASSRPWCR